MVCQWEPDPLWVSALCLHVVPLESVLPVSGDSSWLPLTSGSFSNFLSMCYIYFLRCIIISSEVRSHTAPFSSLNLTSELISKSSGASTSLFYVWGQHLLSTSFLDTTLLLQLFSEAKFKFLALSLHFL